MRLHGWAFLFAGAASVAMAGCGGGGGSSALPHQPSPIGQASKQAPIRVTFPAATSAQLHKAPHFLSASTASFTLQVTTVNGSTPNPLPAPLSISLSDPTYCTTSVSGVTCNINFNVPIATSVTITIITYDATGHALGQGAIGPVDTTQATIPPQPVVVGGVLASIAAAPSLQSAPDDGAVHTLTIAVTGKDQDGNTILPPGTYPTAITLSISGDPNHALSLSPTTIASPGPNGSTNVTLTYTSTTALTSLATITASAGTGVTATSNFSPLTFSPVSLPALLQGGSSQSVTVSEPSYAGVFTATSTGTVASVSCAPANCTPTSAGGSVTLTVTPGTAGHQNVTVSDINGAIATIPVAVTGSSGTGPIVGNATIYTYSAGGTNFGITTGSDGKSLWFVDQSGIALDAIANPSACTISACAVSAVPLPVSSPPVNGLQKIVAAPGGNMYVLDRGDASSSSDPGNFFPLTCTPSPAACSGSQLAYWNFFDNQDPMIPADMIVGPDGALYVSIAYSDSSYDTLIAWTPATTFAYAHGINVGLAPASVNQLAYDPVSSLLWFTDTGNGNVGFVAPFPCLYTCTATEEPSGTVGPTNYGPSGGANPHLGAGGTPFTSPLNGIIAAGGNLFVAEAGAHQIDQLNPTVWAAPCVASGCTYKSMTPTVLPAGTTNVNATPMNFARGPDGNIWFTDTSGYVGFISMTSCATACKAYEYHVGGAPWGITAGSDGNMWFTDSSTNKIGKVVLQ